MLHCCCLWVLLNTAYGYVSRFFGAWKIISSSLCKYIQEQNIDGAVSTTNVRLNGCASAAVAVCENPLLLIHNHHFPPHYALIVIVVVVVVVYKVGWLVV